MPKYSCCIFSKTKRRAGKSLAGNIPNANNNSIQQEFLKSDMLSAPLFALMSSELLHSSLCVIYAGGCLGDSIVHINLLENSLK